MRRALFVLFFVATIGVAVGWVYRGPIRGYLYSSQQPSLPMAQAFRPFAASSTTSSLSATSTKEMKVTKTRTRTLVVATSTVLDPFSKSAMLPESVNLAVPFLSQAPKGDWSYPYEEACEEATTLMVDAFYKGRTQNFQPEEGDKAILDLVAFENHLLGYYEDTSATATARFVTAYFHYPRVILKQNPTVDEIKRALANGYPVILPAYGKALPNPNFRNGGPPYHMVLIKGYLKDGRWITNDSGTHLGANFLYSQQSLMQANHDWNNGDVVHGDRVAMIILPN